MKVFNLIGETDEDLNWFTEGEFSESWREKRAPAFILCRTQSQVEEVCRQLATAKPGDFIAVPGGAYLMCRDITIDESLKRSY